MKKIAILFLLLIQISFARVINIPSDYATIQAGIVASVNGDTVLVAPGVYSETLSVLDKNILLASSGLPESTIVSGFIMFRGSAIDTTCVLRGLKIIRGFSLNHDLIVIDDASPKVQGNIVAGGGWASYAAFTLSHSQAVIQSNIIRDFFSNYSMHGIKSDSGYPTIERNIISHNISNSGFSVYTWGVILDAGILRYNIIAGNGATGYESALGIGVWAGNGPYEISNNTIYGNGAYSPMIPATGGGLSFRVPVDGSDCVIRNNIIVNNSYCFGVSGYIADSAWTGWDYNLVYDNDSLNYLHFQPATHDMQTDPMFVHIDSVNFDSNDYHLLPGSPCIDAGDPSFPLDPDSTRCDIGAYFYDQSVGIDNGAPSGPYQFSLRQNYPNPFNSQTIISYSLGKESLVNLRIMSITGQFIKAIIDKENQVPGEHQYIWDGIDKRGKQVSTGIYFYELYVGDYKESKAMMMIR
jgi:hypothetical protein